MTKKSVLITGCSTGGIGHALAVAFQKRGLTVFATARSPSKMADLASLPNVHLIALDVTDAQAIIAAAKKVEAETGGKLDILVNNAGAMYSMPILDTDVEKAKALFDVNYWAAIRMVKGFGDMVVKAKGVVVNMGSIAGSLGIPMQSTYNTSKAAINILSEGLRLELAPLGVRVLTVMAGNVTSNISENANTITLPEDSYYKPIEKELQPPFPKAPDIPTEQFVEWLANKTLAGTTGMIWNGGNTFLVRWVVPWLPTSVVVSDIPSCESIGTRVGLTYG
ncbi:putative estradiol 17 beta-dehydrogenase [Massarina eburnea CBS 473.64]|uniref:Putative estradiol 17 beta-dehydrogenase n=1 Tax=Massarina eburnea CBS 473.64 TaxID=1395130 RepID=A0A6A6RU39_9PLEO|nr:putative estradiol 17 beta-dehydrogenase [Massarina eburnea CBS 473.64]